MKFRKFVTDFGHGLSHGFSRGLGHGLSYGRGLSKAASVALAVLCTVSFAYSQSAMAQSNNDYAPSASASDGSLPVPPRPAVGNNAFGAGGAGGGNSPFGAGGAGGGNNSFGAGGNNSFGAGAGAAGPDVMLGRHGRGRGGRHQGANGMNTAGGVAGARSGQRKQRMLAKFDANGDGMLDENERAQLKAMMAQRRAARDARGGPRNGRSRNGGLANGGRGKNGGKGGDMQARHQRMIARFDTNGDGSLDATERAAAQAFRQQHKMQRRNSPQ